MRHRRWIGLVVPGAGMLAAGAVWGSAGAILAAIGALVWLAWWFDDEAGTFLPLACMFVLVLAVLAALILLIAVVHLA